MEKYKREAETGDGAETGFVCDAPGEGCKEEEEGKEVGERRVGSVPCVFRFWLK